MFNNRIFDRLKKLFKAKKRHEPMVVKRQNHHISRKNVSQNALKVLYRLKNAGFAAYLVGGSVRDLLLHRQPKDFDVVTAARPEQIRKLFRNSRIIGRRFLLVHVYYPGEIIEVSTFRANNEEFIQDDQELPILSQKANVYGTIEEDAWRRDFTVNALYYNIIDFSVIDYTGGLLDLKKRFIRIIGDPIQRYHEDPVRLLRAIRLAAKLDFTIHPETESPMSDLMGLLRHVPAARLFDEVLKLFFDGYAFVTYQYLRHFKIFDVLFPRITNAIEKRPPTDQKFIESTMKAIDKRFYKGQPVNPGFLFAVLLWPALQVALEDLTNKPLYQAFRPAIDQVIREQKQILTMPRRLTWMMRAIWILQYHLLRRRPQRVFRLYNHRYFRAAIDFLELRMMAGEPFQDVVDWWRRFQKSPTEECQKMVEQL